MTLVKRRMVFGCFCIVFIVASAIVILYAHGYRYHIQKKSIEKTGELVIESIPPGGDIVLNGEHIREKTPARLKYLPSGDYHIEVSKSGYLPWKTDSSVYSGQSTSIRNIGLFPVLEPRLLVKQEDIRILGRLDGSHVYFATTSQLFIYNERTKTFSKLYTGRYIDSSSLMPSPRGGSILFSDQGAYYTGTIHDGSITSVAHAEDMRNIQWVSEYDIIGITQKGLVSLSLRSKEKKLIYRGDVLDSNAGQTIMLLIRDNENTSLLSLSLNGSVPIEIARVPAHYRTIQNVNDGLIVLADERGSNALIIPSKDEKSLIRLPRGSIVWQSQDRLAIINDFELWIVEKNGEDFSSRFLTRQSTPIDYAAFQEGTPYLFFVSEGVLKAIDTTNTGVLNRYTLEGESVGSIVFSGDSTSLFAIEETPGKAGLFEHDLVSR